jgi:hypothetical protein
LKVRTGIVTRPFLYDKRVEKILGCHSQDIGALLRAIHAHYPDRVDMELTEDLAAKSAWYLPSLTRQSGIELQYDGELFTGHEPQFQKVNLLIDLIVSKKQINEAKTKRETHPLAWVRKIQWSQDAKWTYVKVLEMADESGAIKDLRALIEFKMNHRRKLLRFPPISGHREEFQHRAAKAVPGLKSEVQGETSLTCDCPPKYLNYFV